MKFKSLLEQEIRTFWHVITSLEYANRWLSNSSLTTLTKNPGDNKYPFKAINISPEHYVSEIPIVSSYVRENALVSFVTTFECYLFELLERVIYLAPELVDDSDMPFTAKEIAAALPGKDMRRWLAHKVADKYLRNKTHAAMIGRLDKFAKAGISKTLAAEIEEWSRWSLVRNSIVHTSRQVTSDLSRAWSSRFPAAGTPVGLKNEDLARVHHLAIKIAEAIDARAVSTIIKKNDELLVARELFIQRGMEDSAQLKAVINSAMNRLTVKRQDIDRALAEQRRGRREDNWELTSSDLARLVP